MAKELLKEAIADAKAVREVALQNAKMALEEAFDSKIKNMLSAKLAEEIEEDTLDEDYLDEEKDDSDNVDDVSAATESESFDEEINLDELMAELEEDSYEEGANEETEQLDEVTPEASEILTGLATLIGVGTVAFQAAGGVSALKAKLAKAGSSPKAKIKALGSFLGDTGAGEATGTGTREGVDENDVDENDVDENIDIDALIAEIEEDAKLVKDDELEEGATGYDDKVGGKGRTGFDNKPGGKGGTGYDSKKVKKLKEERNAAIATVRSLKGTITEMNLLNSKLLYCNKLFKSNSLTEAQKVKVIDALDLASTTNEAKLVFTTLQESFNFTGVEKRAIKEGLGRASKASGNAPKKVITESVDGTISRFQKLANIKF